MGKRVKKRKISEDRVRKKKVQKNKIIIAVEGSNKTERTYFNNFDDGKKSYSITIAKGNTTDPLSMIKRLDNEVNKLNLDLLNGDVAYCVFDVDINPNKNKIIRQTIEFARKNHINVITSTPSIELWFLLHYEYTTANLSNEEVLKRLKTHFPKYEKNCNIYPILQDKIEGAIIKAKRLEKYQKQGGKKIGTVAANPSTEMYKIVESLTEDNSTKNGSP